MNDLNHILFSCLYVTFNDSVDEMYINHMAADRRTFASVSYVY